jgi:hypothetical protein
MNRAKFHIVCDWHEDVGPILETGQQLYRREVPWSFGAFDVWTFYEPPDEQTPEPVSSDWDKYVHLNMPLEIAHRLREALERYASDIFTPQYRAIMEGVSRIFDGPESKFNALAETWKLYNRGRSVTDFHHFCYTQIIGMGPTVLPILFSRLSSGDSDWIIALRAITGAQVTTPEMRGDPSAVIAAWVDWGHENGFGKKLLSHSWGDLSGDQAETATTMSITLYNGKRSSCLDE